MTYLYLLCYIFAMAKRSIETKAFVFDTVGTVVSFRDTGFRLRPGIKELLSIYKNNGDLSFLTSSDSNDLEKAAAKHNLKGLVVETSYARRAGDGKDYSGIRRLLGWSDVEVKRRMIITGDNASDASANFEAVFLLDDRGVEHDASVHSTVVDKLLEAGKKDL